jgi:hypothetical protein
MATTWPRGSPQSVESPTGAQAIKPTATLHAWPSTQPTDEGRQAMCTAKNAPAHRENPPRRERRVLRVNEAADEENCRRVGVRLCDVKGESGALHL